jgi:uncharacterized integral membrane protein (TIGR00697 family)
MSNYKYFIYIAIAFVTVLLVSNTVAVKLIVIGPFVLAGATLLFPISYIFGDILTEVYGYKASRKIIWSGFAALIFMSFSYYLVQILPSPVFWTEQTSYENILGFAPRIVLASIVAFLIGEFVNSFILSKMKIYSNGKKLWQRTIGSTIVGEGLDTVIFTTIAFYGTVPFAALLTIIWSGYFVKVAIEILATPITYKIVNWLKKEEGIDVFDKDVNYNPFKI